METFQSIFWWRFCNWTSRSSEFCFELLALGGSYAWNNHDSCFRRLRFGLSAVWLTDDEEPLCVCAKCRRRRSGGWASWNSGLSAAWLACSKQTDRFECPRSGDLGPQSPSHGETSRWMRDSRSWRGTLIHRRHRIGKRPEPIFFTTLER